MLRKVIVLLLLRCKYFLTSISPGRKGFQGSSNLELKHLLITIRHGDRSSIHSIPNAGKIYSNSNSSETAVLLRESVRSVLPKLANYNVNIIDNNSKESGQLESFDEVSDPYLKVALSKDHLFSMNDLALPPGQLTSLGFYQHLLLGKALQESYYTEILRYVNSPTDIYVRSTNYARTIQVDNYFFKLLDNIIVHGIFSP